MRHEKQPRPGSGLLLEDEPPAPFVTFGYRIALEQLHRAFTQARPVAVLSGAWTSGKEHIVREFIAGVKGGAAEVRITEPGPDAAPGMRQLIDGIGYEPDGMSLSDLEKTFSDFLIVQRARHRRTIIIIEESNDNTEWALEKVHHFARMETDGKFGLLVILLRKSDLNGPPDHAPSDEIFIEAAQQIAISTFTPAETRDYIRWRIEAHPAADISIVFEYQATSLIHELSWGIPDVVDKVCCQSIRLADEEDVAPVTTDLVIRASKLIQLPSAGQESIAEIRPVEPAPKPNPRQNGASPICVMVTKNGETILETTIQHARLTIGRADDNNILINDRFVSRHHAVLDRHGDEVHVTDLNSTNGTFVNSNRIRKSIVVRRDIVAIGNYCIMVDDPNRLSDPARIGRTFNSGVGMLDQAGLRNDFAN